MSEQAQPQAKPAAVRGNALLWVQGLACGAVAVALPALAALLAVLLAPAMIALLLDRQPGKPIARCLVMAGLAAAMPALRRAWEAGLGTQSLQDVLSDPMTLGTVWSAAAAGWLAAELAPLAVRAALEGWARVRIARLRAEAARLGEAWEDIEDQSETAGGR
ncbi:MAG: hypothetical protein JSR21_12890 [Proteobacteria bacterium]|nr:hypothetical protein [Pseudomonadota bacterium]